MNSYSLRVFLIFFSITFIPSFIYVTFRTNSLATGFILLVPIIILLSWGSIKLDINIKSLFIMLMIAVYTIYIPFYWDAVIEYKGVVSFLLLMFIFFYSSQAANYISQYNHSNNFDKTIKYISVIFLTLGVISIYIRPHFFNYDLYIKSSFPFSEPSHYSISCIPFFMYGALNSKRHIMTIYLLVMLFLSLKLPSVIMMASTILTLFIITLRFKHKLIAYIFSIAILLLIGKYIINLDMSDYFVSRLNFSPENKNLTSLVYIQGWQDLMANVINTNGIGLGFQRMGTNEPNELNEFIFSLSGEYKNISDGSFLASKIVSEFGIIAIILLLTYAKLVIKCLADINVAFKKNINDPIYLFSRITIISFSIELFLRGIGYFSSSMVIFLISINLLGKEKWKQL